MLSEIFYWVLNISIIGSAAGLILLALRKIKKLPRLAVYVLWAIPLLRLWLPLGIANKYSLLSFISKFTTKTVIVWQNQEIPEVTLSMSNAVMGAERYFPVVYKTDLLAGIFSVASVIWIIIASSSILASVLLYAFTKSELKNAVRIRGNIYQSDKITAPAVYGVIHPKIIIPAVIADGDIGYIVMHERVHIKRKDNLFRVIAMITACVHWFNPLIWIFLKCFFADMELACDAKVLKHLDTKQIRDYASAILACASGKVFFASAFGGAKTKVRIENILSYKKLTLLSSLCFAALVAVIAVVLITNAVG
jgi:Antirepressor regulating drug resistance, predicted signal transduction N-terminal membrane component